MKNRTITGNWDGEIISRPKTLGERHPNIMNSKHKALKKISKEELHAKFVARHGGAGAMKSKAEATRHAIHSHTPSSGGDHADYQKRIGRAYSE